MRFHKWSRILLVLALVGLGVWLVTRTSQPAVETALHERAVAGLSAGSPRLAPSAPNGGAAQERALAAEVANPADSIIGAQVFASIKNDLSAPLSSIPPIKPEQGLPDPDMLDLHPLPGRLGAQPPSADFVDAALQQGAVKYDLLAPIQNFDGVNNVNGVLPPDTNGDVGPNHYMQWVNLSFAIYSKTGALLYGPANGNTLFSGFGGPCQSTNNGDPIVLYDHLADRWLASQFALPSYPSGPYYECIAISQTPDPTGAWYRYQFQISATKMNDYPHLGVWPDGYYMSVNHFHHGSSWAGAGAVAFERDKMLAGLPAQMVYFDLYGVDPNLGGMLPTDLDGPVPPVGAPNYFSQMDDNSWGYSPDQVQIWQFHVDWTTPANSTFTLMTALPTAAFDSNMCGYNRNCVPQLGTTARLDALSDRVLHRQQYRNWGTYQTMLLNHTVDANGADRAGVRWYELRNSGGGWSIYQQGTYSPDATHRWMASIAMDGNGNIGLGYSASSSTINPAIRYTGRLPGDPLGTMTQGDNTIINGTGSQTHSAARWGDYSNLSIDPVDDCTFWYTTEYLQTTGSAPWRTRIASFQLPNCGGTPPSETGFLNPSANNPVTSGSGDNNGFQTNPTNAYSDNATFAVDTDSGTGLGTSCTSTKRDRHIFYNYNVSLPGGSTVSGIQVRLDAKVDSTIGKPAICVELSWNGGTTWTTAKQTTTLTTGEVSYVLGSSSDTWGHTWTTSELDNTNFRVRVVTTANSQARDFSLDWLTVNVTYQ